jgi:hypothetical protein
MIWIAPSEKDVATGTLEKRLWDTADQFRANSTIKSFGTRSSPTRARVNGAMTTRLSSGSPLQVKGSKQMG